MFLDYHMKFSHRHVDATAAALAADLGSCQTFMMKFFCEKKYMIDV